MRILVVSAQKPDSTGSGVYLSETVSAFAAAGHDVAVIVGIDKDDDPSFPPGVLFFPVRFRTQILPFSVCGMSDAMPYEATRYRDMTPDMVCAFTNAFHEVVDRVLKDFAPDLVFCHHLYLVTAVVVECRPACPTVALSHSTDIRQMRTHGLEHDRIVRAVRQLDEILALHREQVHEIADCYGVDERRIRVVGTGYNAHIFHRLADAEADRLQRREQGIVHLVYAGKITRKKGVDSFVRSLSYSGLDPSACSVVLAGGYNDPDEYASIVARAAKTPYDIRFAGQLSQEALAKAYNDADIFVLPSFFEGLPLVVIEALASGCTAVITDLPGIREWIEEYLPDAPVVYVEPPAMKSIDEPCESELAAFEERLGKALGQAAGGISQTGPCFDASALSWEALAERILAPYVQTVRSVRSGQPRRSERSGQPGRSVQPAQPERTAQTVRPAQPEQSAQPVQSDPQRVSECGSGGSSEYDSACDSEDGSEGGSECVSEEGSGEGLDRET